jgi:hypothetical protein
MPRPILSPEQQKSSVESAQAFVNALQARALAYIEIGKEWGFPVLENPNRYRQEVIESVEALSQHMRVFNLTEVTWEADEGEHRRGRLLGWGFKFNKEDFTLAVTIQDEALPANRYPVHFDMLRSIGGISLEATDQA